MGQSTPTTALNGEFDTLPIQCRHIEHATKEFGSEKIIFDKMTAVTT